MTLIATDLDRTLIFSERFVAQHPTSTELAEVEPYQDRNVSLMAVEVREGLAVLAEHATLIPTTTRTRAQLRRVDLGFTPAYEICCSGGVILHRDSPDLGWARSVQRITAAECMTHADAEAAFAPWTGRPWMRQLRDAEGIFLIASVDGASLPADELEALTETFTVGNWRVVHQGSKVYALPRVVTKWAAVNHVREQLGGEVWAAGDSVLDWDMLAHSHRSWTAPDSELAGTGRQAAHLDVLDSPGLDSSVDLVRAWRALLGV